MMRVYDRMLGLPRQLGILSLAASINELSTRQNMCQVPQFEKRVQTVGWQSRRINVDIAMREVIQEVRKGCALVREKAVLQVRGSRRVARVALERLRAGSLGVRLEEVEGDRVVQRKDGLEEAPLIWEERNGSARNAVRGGGRNGGGSGGSRRGTRRD